MLGISRREPPIDQRLCDFQRHPDAGKMLERVRAIRAAGVDDGHGVRKLRRRLVVIGDDDVQPEVVRDGHLRSSRDAAVNGDDEARAPLRQPAKRVNPEAVAIAIAMWDEHLDAGAKRPKCPLEQRSAAQAVHVVVAVNHDRLTTIERPFDAHHGGFQPSHRIKVGRHRTRRREVCGCFGGVSNAPIQEKLSQQRRPDADCRQRFRASPAITCPAHWLGNRQRHDGSRPPDVALTTP